MRPPPLARGLPLLFGAASTAVLVVLGYLVGMSVQAHFVEIDRDELLGKVQLVRHTLAKVRTAAEFAAMPGRMDDALIGHPHLGVRLSAPDGELLYASADASFPAEDFPMRLAEGMQRSPDITTWRHGSHAFRGTMTTVPTGYPERKSAACAPHARRRFEELSRVGSSASGMTMAPVFRNVPALTAWPSRRNAVSHSKVASDPVTDRSIS